MEGNWVFQWINKKDVIMLDSLIHCLGGFLSFVLNQDWSFQSETHIARRLISSPGPESCSWSGQALPSWPSPRSLMKWMSEERWFQTGPCFIKTSWTFPEKALKGSHSNKWSACLECLLKNSPTQQIVQWNIYSFDVIGNFMHSPLTQIWRQMKSFPLLG